MGSGSSPGGGFPRPAGPPHGAALREGGAFSINYGARDIFESNGLCVWCQFYFFLCGVEPFSFCHDIISALC